MFCVRAAGICVEARQGGTGGIRWVRMLEESCGNKQRDILISFPGSGMESQSQCKDFNLLENETGI